MSNKLNYNSINAVLSIADAKINRQSRLKIDNVKYVVSLFNPNLKVIAL